MAVSHSSSQECGSLRAGEPLGRGVVFSSASLLLVPHSLTLNARVATRSPQQPSRATVPSGCPTVRRGLARNPGCTRSDRLSANAQPSSSRRGPTSLDPTRSKLTLRVALRSSSLDGSVSPDPATRTLSKEGLPDRSQSSPLSCSWRRSALRSPCRLSSSSVSPARASGPRKGSRFAPMRRLRSSSPP